MSSRSVCRVGIAHPVYFESRQNIYINSQLVGGHCPPCFEQDILFFDILAQRFDLTALRLAFQSLFLGIARRLGRFALFGCDRHAFN